MIRNLPLFILFLGICACSGRILFPGNIHKLNYAVTTSDKKTVKGILYREFGEGKLKEVFYKKTNAFSADELNEIKKRVNKEISAEKMLLSGLEINPMENVGLYGLDIIDLHADTLARSFGFDSSFSVKVKSVTYPILKFKNRSSVNVCSSTCSDSAKEEIEQTCERFRNENSQFFTAQQMDRILDSYKKGRRVFAGGRFR